jgi:hypothetical protein
MAKIGYIMTAPGYNDYEADVKWMEEFGCVDKVFQPHISLFTSDTTNLCSHLQKKLPEPVIVLL